MSIYDHAEVEPRNGHTLMAAIVARISGCPNQKEMSLDDQVDHGKEVVSDIYSGKAEYNIIATRGKGEQLDRPELVELENLLRTRTLDVLVAEDIGRMVRGADAVRLCGIAVDMGVRVIAPNDCVDTWDADWEETVIQACRDHVGHNSHTSKRIKHKKMNRFLKFGGATPCEIAGYIKPEDAKTFDDWQIEESATPIIREGLRILKETLNCCAVAAYFNEVRFLPGKHCTRKEWDGKMVRRLYKNTILSGRPGRGHRHTIKRHEKGKRVSVKNPKGPKFIERPHLAHIPAAEQDSINSLLDQKNNGRGRKQVNGADPRLHVPKMSTVFPSQHARCWYCGFHFVRGANGIKEHIMCSHAREWHCWNSIGVDCELAAKAVVKAISENLYALEAFDSQFRELVTLAHGRRAGSSGEAWRKLEKSETQLQIAMNNIVNGVEKLGPTMEFEQRLEVLKQQRIQLAAERHALESRQGRKLRLPPTVAELRTEFKRQFEGLAIDSPKFGSMLWSIVPEFHVFLVRLLDGGHLLPRARVKVDLAAACKSDLAFVPEMSTLLTRVVTLDLFVPPQRVRVLEECVRLAATGMYQRQIAEQVSEPVSQAVIQKALELHRLVNERGLSSPYEMVYEPPNDYAKLRRHRNPRYVFMPLAGYERPTV